MGISAPQAAASPELLPAQVVAKLRAAIIDSVLTPGTRLVERVLAGHLEIGRRLVREAIQATATHALEQRARAPSDT